MNKIAMSGSVSVSGFIRAGGGMSSVCCGGVDWVRVASASEMIVTISNAHSVAFLGERKFKVTSLVNHVKLKLLVQSRNLKER